MKQLNEKERAVLDYICRVTQEKGYAPSVRDIGSALGYKSTSTVQLYLDRLLSYGILLRESGKSRSLRVHPDYLSADAPVAAYRIPCYADGNAVKRGEAPVGYLRFAYEGDARLASSLFAIPAGEERNGRWLVGIRDVAVTDGERVLAIDAQGKGTLCRGPFVFGVTVLGKALASIESFDAERV
ncbi:MAG: hypothetical protein IKC31_01210 [Clostridia bacterium]|nr:hypothetical protein [Clostridia bacterium]